MSTDSKKRIKVGDGPIIIKKTKRSKKTRRKSKAKGGYDDGDGEQFIPLETPTLAPVEETCLLFDKNAFRKRPSPNQEKNPTIPLGEGVVANKMFKEGEIVCTYGGKILSHKQYLELTRKHDPRCPRVAYLIDIVKDVWYVDGHPSNPETSGHVGQYINDARNLVGCKTNCYIEVDITDEYDGLYRVYIKTNKVNEGTEFFLSYGEEYWDFDETYKDRCDCNCLR